jgi:aminoglycoside 2'-N-acetyltransferase I
MTTQRFSYRLLPTAALAPRQLRAIRSLLEVAFDGDFGASDWDHSLGGVHVLARQEDTVVGHAAVVQRHLAAGMRALRVGYVEALAVHPRWRRRGIGDQIMVRVERVIRRAYDLGALSASDQALPLYERRGWVPWRGELSALTPNGVIRTPEETVHVLVGELAVDLHAELMCDWREGDVW